MFRLLPSRRYANELKQRRQQFTTAALSRAGWKVDLDTGIITFQSKPLFQTVIGLEIHAQLDIPTKLFSSASTVNANPNQSVHPLDVAVPGTLPILSKDAVHAAVLAAAACNCEIQLVSRFERKHYAYADQPLGYQMTQQRWPLARHGQLQSRKRAPPGKTNSADKLITVGIDRIQLEQDTGKTTTLTRNIVSHFTLYMYVHQGRSNVLHETD